MKRNFLRQLYDSKMHYVSDDIMPVNRTQRGAEV